MQLCLPLTGFQLDLLDSAGKSSEAAEEPPEQRTWTVDASLQRTIDLPYPALQ